MDKIFTNNSWSKILDHIPEDTSKFAAVAYVTKGSLLKFGDGDTLICDASESSIKNGNTDANTLMTFKKNGAKIYSCDNLHAKIIVCGDYAIIGSSNLSKSSEEDLLEATLITDRRQIRAQILGLIHNLMIVSDELKEEDINKLIKLPVSKRTRRAKLKKIVVNDSGTSYWVVSVNPIKKVKKEEEADIEEGEDEASKLTESEMSEIGYIRLTGNTFFRQNSKVGDIVVEIFKNKRTASVTEPRPILYKQEKEKWTRVYLEVNEEHAEMSWGNFEKKLKENSITNIMKNSTRKINTKDSLVIEKVWKA